MQKPLAWAWLLSLLLQQLIFHSVKSVFLKHWLLISVCLKFLTEILVLDRCLITWEKSTDKICLFACACYKKCDNDCLDPRPNWLSFQTARQDLTSHVTYETSEKRWSNRHQNKVFHKFRGWLKTLLKGKRFIQGEWRSQLYWMLVPNK